MGTYIESELEFTLPTELVWEELDRQGVTLPNGLKLVDFVIDLEDALLLVEIKDPSCSTTPELGQRQYFTKLRNDDILKAELTPKGRGSYTFLHLMERDAKPMKYIVVLGLEAFDVDMCKPLLTTFADRLTRSIRKEASAPWKRIYIQECVVLSVDGWNERFREWPIRRLTGSSH